MVCMNPIFKGAIRNYNYKDLDTIFEIIKHTPLATVDIDINEARGRFRVMVRDGLTRYYSDDFDIGVLHEVVRRLMEMDYVLVGKDYLHDLMPVTILVFRKAYGELKKIFTGGKQ